MVTELDIQVPLGAPPKMVVDHLLVRLVELGLVTSADALSYQARPDLIANDESLARIRTIQAARAAETEA